MTCNIFLIGKTGAGKSSLLNYMSGNRPLAQVGVSSVVGGVTKDFHEYKVLFYGIDCNIIDSEGYEVSKMDYWNNMIDTKISSFLQSDYAEESFPIIIYCIDGCGGRIVDEDLKIIKNLENLNIGIVPVITKADRCSNDDLLIMGDILYNEYKENLPVFICSDLPNQVADDRLNLVRGIVGAWSITVRNRFADYVFDINLSQLANWEQDVRSWIYSQNAGFSGLSKDAFLKEINSKIEKRLRVLNFLITKRTENGLKVVEHLNEHFGNLNDGSIVMDILSKLSLRGKTFNFKQEESGVWETIGIGVLGIALLPVLLIPLIVSFSKDKKRIPQEVDKLFTEKVEEIRKDCIEQKKNIGQYMMGI